MSYDVKKSHLRAAKIILLDIKESLEDLEYWTKENDLEIVKLCEEDIKKKYKIMKRCMRRL